MPNIFDYLNYPSYLKDYYEARKRQNRYFSYRFMGRFLGMDPGFLVKVVQGRTQLPEKAIPAVAKLCKMAEREAEYFEALVQYGRAKTREDIKNRYERLIALRGMESRPLDPTQYDYYRKWYNGAIRALLTFWDFGGDYAALAARIHPPISEQDARESVALLESLGIIRKASSGRYEVLGPPITTGEKWRSAAISRYQQESIELALQSLMQDPKHVRDISTLTVAIRFQDLEEIKSRIKELRQSLMHMMSDNGDPDCVYQLNFQVFPLTRVNEGTSLPAEVLPGGKHGKAAPDGEPA